MINWLLRKLRGLLGRPGGEVPEYNPDPEPKYTVEFYPFSGRYYPKVGSHYLKWQMGTGIYRHSEFEWADSYPEEASAWRTIDTYREQQKKVGVITITITSRGKRS